MTPEKSERSAGTPAGQRQVLTFNLGPEIYGVEVLRVHEIRGWSPVTRLPHAPSHVLGVLNLRGSVVPIVDLRMRFGLPQVEFTPLTVIVVLSVQGPSGRRDVGLVVDGVSDVIDLDASQLRAAPGDEAGAGGDVIEALATVENRMLILLDVDALLGRDGRSEFATPLAGAA